MPMAHDADISSAQNRRQPESWSQFLVFVITGIFWLSIYDTLPHNCSK